MASCADIGPSSPEFGTHGCRELAEQILDNGNRSVSEAYGVEALLIKTRIASALNDDQQAVCWLARAIDQGVSLGMLRIFLDEGPPLQTLLRKLAGCREPEFQHLQSAIVSSAAREQPARHGCQPASIVPGAGDARDDLMNH